LAVLKADVATAMETLNCNYKCEKTKPAEDIYSRMTSQLTSKHQTETRKISNKLRAQYRAETVHGKKSYVKITIHEALPSLRCVISINKSSEIKALEKFHVSEQLVGFIYSLVTYTFTKGLVIRYRTREHYMVIL